MTKKRELVKNKMKKKHTIFSVISTVWIIICFSFFIIYAMWFHKIFVPIVVTVISCVVIVIFYSWFAKNGYYSDMDAEKFYLACEEKKKNNKEYFSIDVSKHAGDAMRTEVYYEVFGKLKLNRDINIDILTKEIYLKGFECKSRKEDKNVK